MSIASFILTIPWNYKLLSLSAYKLTVMKKLAFLASGNGTNLQAVIDAVESGILQAEISIVISDRVNAYALTRARNHGINAVEFPRTAKNRGTYFDTIAKLIEDSSADLIVLGGFMKILPDEFIRKFENMIINIHPSLLPCFGGKGFYGSKVHEAVLESGARISGCTVHFTSAEVDGGPILEQRTVQVADDDTPESLADRIHPVEHEALVYSVGLVLDGNYEIKGKRVIRKS